MGTLKEEVKDVVKEFWYAPMYLPLFLTFEITGRIEKWYNFVMSMFIAIPIMLILTALMFPVQIIVFVFIAIAAPIVAAINLVRGAIK